MTLGTMGGGTLPVVVKLGRLRFRREMAGLTQEELAARAGVSKNALGALERGASEPRPSTIRRLAEALGCQPEELVSPDAS